MASGNNASKPVAVHHDDDDKIYKEREEIERIKEYLQEVLIKNQHLEEMLLYTSQELEKEKENSRKIVQTLTERLMESREMINKLEVENMRYKKDCSLAVELLQCNRSVDQEYVTRTVGKLSGQMDPTSAQTLTFGNSFATEENVINNPANSETKNIQETNPRTVSKKKIKSEATDTNEDRTALLEKQETHEAQAKFFDQEDKTTKNNEPIDKQYKETTYKTGISGLPLMTASSHHKQTDIGEMDDAKDSFTKGEKESLNEECQREHKSLIKGKNLETTDDQVGLNSVQHERRNSVEEECILEDKPLIVDGTRPSTPLGLRSLPLKENVKSPGKNPQTAEVCAKAEVKNTGDELLCDTRQGSTTLPTTVENKNISTKKRHENQADNEADKLLSPDEEESEGSCVQHILPETNTAASEHEAESNESEVTAFIDDDEKLSMDESSEKVKYESSDEQVETPVAFEADDETPTAEENTPLV